MKKDMIAVTISDLFLFIFFFYLLLDSFSHRFFEFAFICEWDGPPLANSSIIVTWRSVVNLIWWGGLFNLSVWLFFQSYDCVHCFWPSCSIATRKSLSLSLSFFYIIVWRSDFRPACSHLISLITPAIIPVFHSSFCSLSCRSPEFSLLIIRKSVTC